MKHPDAHCGPDSPSQPQLFGFIRGRFFREEKKERERERGREREGKRECEKATGKKKKEKKGMTHKKKRTC